MDDLRYAGGQSHPKLSYNGRGDRAVHRLRIARGVDERAASRGLRRDLAETLAQSLMKIAAEALEPISRRSQRRAAEAHLDRNVEDQCQIRHEIAEGKTVQRRELVEPHAFSVTLIS